jgi:DNA-binding MarR family transcriptional regulator
MGEALKTRLKQARFENAHHEAMLNLMVAGAHMRAAVDRACAQHGITQGQYNVLRILRGIHPEGYPRGEISTRMVDRSPDVTRLIDRLERQELVERTRSGKDRRLSVTRITKRGLLVLDELAGAIDAIHEELQNSLSAKEARELSRLCEAVYGGKRRSSDRDSS